MKRAPWTLVIGSVITFIFISLALISLVWTPHDPSAINILHRLKGPGESGLLGSDHFGRDELSMVMVGARVSLGIAISSVLIGATIGSMIGMLTASERGRFDALVMRVNDVLFAFPPVLSAILLAAVLGGGPETTVVAIALFMIPVFSRISRSAALQIWARDYVLAARMAGKRNLQISFEHVLPNISAQLIVQLAIQTGLAILTEAGLSFLGLGVAPPTASWGRMLADAQTYISLAPHLVLVPGLAIALTVLGLNLLGDGIRDWYDPKSKRTL